MNRTEEIYQYINDLFKKEATQEGHTDVISIRRKDVAAYFNCVPSQINYVLRSRFNPERGYLVESQRGGNGYIRILRINTPQPDEKLKHYEDLMHQGPLTPQTIQKLLSLLIEQEIISSRERLLVELGLRGISELAEGELYLPEYRKAKLQSEWLRRVLRSLILS